MENSEHHVMIVAKRHENGTEEWACPICGRRFLLQWPPEYRRIILNPGDEQATHTGGSGGVSMGAAETHPDPTSEPEPQVPLDDLHASGEPYDGAYDDPYLGPWADFMNTLDL